MNVRGLKVAFFVNKFPIMSEAFVATSAGALQEKGNLVHIYGFGGGEATGSAVDAATEARLEGRAWNAATPSSLSEHLVTAPRALAFALRNFGLRAFGAFNPIVYRRSIENLASLYQAAILQNGGRYDILHCQFATLGEFVLKHKQAGLLSGKLVVHFRGYDISEVVQTCGPHVYDRLFATADYFIANCEHFRRKAVALGCPAERIDVVGSGIDLANFPFRGAKKVSENSVRFVSIGRLIERKGVHVALDALALLSREGMQFQFDVVGNGPMRLELERKARILGLSDRVTFHGARTHSEILGILEDCHIMLATSLTPADGSQDATVNTVKEAMAVGVLVVGTRHGGIPELVEEGQTGTLCRENDPGDLAEAVRRLLGGAESWDAVARRSRSRVEENFAIAVTNERLLNVYEKALSWGGEPGRRLGPGRMPVLHRGGSGRDGQDFASQGHHRHHAA
ncbi:glycosyltransferase [Mesorhizobium sp. 1B3]|uniref:glycosyltransferase n=1 Tax=Mesorhizobium sp. 1B3 TaxID=3243599 RepID=UPI003D9510A8